MTRRLTIHIAALSFFLVLASCDEPPSQICDPGMQQECYCVGGGTGIQECAHDGSRWSHCECIGPDGDGDVDADGDSDTDGDGDADTPCVDQCDPTMPRLCIGREVMGCQTGEDRCTELFVEQNCEDSDMFCNPSGESPSCDVPCEAVYEGSYTVSDELTMLELSWYESVTGYLLIEAFELPELNGLDCLRSVQQLHITSNSDLVSLQGLSPLERVELYIHIEGNSRLTALHGLEGLTVFDTVSISHNDSLTSLDGLPTEATVFDLSISGANLTSLDPADHWAVTGSLFICGTRSLTNLGSWDNLEALFDVNIDDNSALESLEGFSTLQAVSALSITNNDFLRSLTELSSLTEITDMLIVENNRNLPTCEVDALLARLTVLPVDVIVEGNDDEGTCE